MGAWGADSFDNDVACDWALALKEADDLAVVEAAIDAVASDDGEYVDADVACEAIAACEVVARLRGKVGTRNAYTETVDAWVKAHPMQPSKALVNAALQALVRVLGEGSELRELWSDSGETEWIAAVENLRERLG